MMWSSLVLVLLLTGQGFSQCFTGTDCTGDQVPASSQRDCCIETDTGLSYNDGGTCTVCIGPIQVGYEFTQYTTSEEEGVVELCAIIYVPAFGVAPRDFVIEANTTDASAVAGQDYVATSNERLMFSRGDTVMCHRIHIIDDDICEVNPAESFFSQLTYVSGILPIDVSPQVVEVIINDENEPECAPIEVGYEFTQYVTSEGQGAVDLSIIIFNPPTGGAPREFSLSVSTEDGTAIAPGDYGAVTNEIIIFTRGQVRETRRVITNQDDECETDPDENFFSNLVFDSGIQPITVIRPRAEIIIDDSNEPECANITVGYERTLYTTPEGDTEVELCVVIYKPPSGGTPRSFVLSYSTADGTAITPDDYIATTGELTFQRGDTAECHRVRIVNDGICERLEIEHFLSNLRLVSGMPAIIPTARVEIEDSSDCHMFGGVFVNDTLIGDPLLTVPLFDDPNVAPGDPISKLCYELHGEANAYFNLISDECTSVSAFYQTASTPSPNIDLNVVTQIGVRAVGNSDRCYNIQVNLDSACNATVDGHAATNNTFDGITVRQYLRSRRVRISVPNCADTMLVMWVFCRDGQVENPVTWEYFDVSFIRYVVMRGLNLNEQSHGIIGQFWNVPITIVPYTGLFNGEARDDDFVITVSPPDPDDPQRSFVGRRGGVTWEFVEGPCYYVGNTQAGRLAELDDPNDSVITGIYSDYKVDTLFSTAFEYAHFNEPRCHDEYEPECAPIEVGYEFTQYVTSEGQGAVDLSIIIFDPYTGRAPRPFTLSVSTEHGTAMAPGDYGAVANQIITFAEGQMRATHTIIINQDDDCEYDPNENFFSNISLNSDKQPISVIRPRAEVIIDDTNEPECPSPTTTAMTPKSVTSITDPPSTMNPEPSIEIIDTSTDPSSPDSTPAIIGAVVAILIIAITVTVIGIAALKYRHRNLSLKHAKKFELIGLPRPAMVEGTAIITTDNTAYGVMKQGVGEPENGYEMVDTSPPGAPPPADEGEKYEMEGTAIKTTGNAAYGVMKQGVGEPESGYEMVDTSPPGGPPPADEGDKYDVPASPHCREPLPATPTVGRAGKPNSPPGGGEEEDGVYEIIPGDK